MEDGGEQNKSEQPTPFKLSKAREKGSVARGADLAFLTGLSAFLGWMWIMGRSLGDQLQHATRSAIVSAPNVVNGQNEILAVTGAIMGAALRPLAFMAVAIFVIVLVFEIAQLGGFMFTTEPLRLDFGKLNPAKGFKRVFSVRMLVETGKNVLKLAVYGAAAFAVIKTSREVEVAALVDAPHLADAMMRIGLKLVMVFVAIAVVFAALDQFIARRDFTKKMRMSRREVRRELRDREGEPRIKQKRKQLHREFVKLSQSLRNIRDADVLVTNPTHYAVALRYDTHSMSAPRVVSQGANQFALRLKRLAFLYGVTIVEDRALARALYQRCALNSEVPEACYASVAAIYRAIRDKAAAQSKGVTDA